MMSYLYLFTITPYYNISDLIWIWKPEWTMLKWSFNMFNIQCHTLQLVIVCHVLVVQLPIITNHQAQSIVHLSCLGVPVFVPSIFHKHLCVSSFYHCSLSPFIQHMSPTVSVLSLCHSKLNFRYPPLVIPCVMWVTSFLFTFLHQCAMYSFPFASQCDTIIFYHGTSYGQLWFIVLLVRTSVLMTGL